MTDEEKKQRIAELNDMCRTSLGAAAGRVMQTSGVLALPDADRAAIYEKVRTFKAFDAGNDPYGEHDFGNFDHDGWTIYWKIDYYADETMEDGSEDPSDPTKTVRVLMIMLAEEY